MARYPKRNHRVDEWDDVALPPDLETTTSPYILFKLPLVGHMKYISRLQTRAYSSVLSNSKIGLITLPTSPYLKAVVMNPPTELSHEARDLLIYTAHEALWTASSVASQIKNTQQVQQYRHLLTTGISALEAVVNDRNCPQNTKAYTTYILAQVLYCETSCWNRVEFLLSRGMVMATQSGLLDLVLQMECLNVRVLSRTNRKAALHHCMKCLEKYSNMHENYAYYTLQMFQFDLMLDTNPRHAFETSQQWEQLPDGPPKCFLLLYGFIRALQMNIGSIDETVHALGRIKAIEEQTNLAHYVPQVTMLRLVVKLLVSLRRDVYEPVETAARELESFIGALQQSAANRNSTEWENWYVDGSIKLTGGQGSTFNIQWLTNVQCTQMVNLLLGVARLRNYKTKSAARANLKECIRLVDAQQPGIGVPGQASCFSHVTENMALQRTLKCTALLYLSLVEFCSFAFKKGRRAFDRFVSESKKLSKEEGYKLQRMAFLVAGVGAHCSGRTKKAMKYYMKIDQDEDTFILAIANMCCIDPSEKNMTTLKETMAEIPQENHILKHSLFEILRLVEGSQDMSPLERQESMRVAWKSLNQGMTQQLSYVCTLVCVDRFETIAEKSAAMESSLQAAISASDCVWAYVIGLKNRELLHKRGQQDRLDGLNKNMVKVKKYVSMLINGQY